MPVDPLPRPPAFVPFDEHRAVRIYQRNLPHWRQDGCTYFVTFRLADSILESVRSQWEAEKRDWLKARGITYDGPRGKWRVAFERLPTDEQWKFEKHFNRQVQSCLDSGLGECWLRRKDCLEILRSKLLADDGVAYHLGDFVIMPNHVHLLTTPLAEGERAEGERNEFRSTSPARRTEFIPFGYALPQERNEFRSTSRALPQERNEFRSASLELESPLKKIKGSSARECNRLLGRSSAFWQADSYDHIVRSLEQLQAYRCYTATNPQEAGIAVPPVAVYRADWIDRWFAPPSKSGV